MCIYFQQCNSIVDLFCQDAFQVTILVSIHIHLKKTIHLKKSSLWNYNHTQNYFFPCYFPCYSYSHLSRHFNSVFISSAESITLSPGTQVESVLSSEYWMNLNWFKHFVISFMPIKNRRGPKIAPCGRPYGIILQFVFTLFIHTYGSLFVRYERGPVQSYSSYTISIQLW